MLRRYTALKDLEPAMRRALHVLTAALAIGGETAE
jgi:hypothetical protein